MMRRYLIITVLLAFTLQFGFSQEYEKLTLEDIYKKTIFKLNSVKGLQWMKKGDYYASLVRNNRSSYQDLIKFSASTGEVVDTLISGAQLIPVNENKAIHIETYQFNDDESKLLISTEVQKIYRRSSRSVNYVYNFGNKELSLLIDGEKQSYATFSPDGSKVGFVRDNNLYIKDLTTNELIAVTRDGKKNEIINGFADWVYEEELSLSKAFFWSPDGEKIAYLKFDESEVPVYNLQKWTGLYPEDYRYKYPKAGQKNSVVTIHIYDLKRKNTIEIAVGKDEESYIARLQWLPFGATISIIRLNRLQNKLDILHGDAVSGKTCLIYSEQSDTYIDIDEVDDLTYLPNGKSFVLSSEKSGFKHLYLYSMNGKLINQITEGEWEVTDFYGIAERKNILYFTSTQVSSLERHIYSITLNGKNQKKLSSSSGFHSANFNPDFNYYIDTYSSSDTPNTTALCDSKGKIINVLAENSDYLLFAKRYGFAKTEFFSLEIDSGDSLNAYIMKPVDFDKNKKYPVLMFVYGGPGSQRVQNSWNSNLWHHYLTQQGYLVACFDNRGTGGKGRDFQHIIYKQLGKYESKDQISSAKYLASLPFVNNDRIGIWGWSYGGYISSLSLLLGNDVFKAAIAVAPVTNWRYYDSIYTERYLQKPRDNPSGYDDYSPQYHADKLAGALMLIHGTGDDNVHFQNSVEFQNALIKANKQFDSFYYPNRDHSIYGGNTQLHLYTMMTNFILENL